MNKMTFFDNKAATEDNRLFKKVGLFYILLIILTVTFLLTNYSNNISYSKIYRRNGDLALIIASSEMMKIALADTIRLQFSAANGGQSQPGIVHKIDTLSANKYALLLKVDSTCIYAFVHDSVLKKSPKVTGKSQKIFDLFFKH